MNQVIFEASKGFLVIYRTINEFLNAVEPSILQGVTMGLITILVSLFIAQLNSNSDFGKLDIWVILDHILEFRKFILITASSLVIPSVWKISIVYNFHLLLFILWASLNFIIINKLLKFYSWIKGNKNEIRLSYLKNLSKPEDIEFGFNSIWKANNLSNNSESRYFEIFREKIKTLVREGAYSTVADMLSCFENYVKNVRTLEYSEFITENILIMYYDLHSLSNNELLFEQGFPLDKKIKNDENIKQKFDQITQAIDSTLIIIKEIEKTAINNSKTRQFFLQLEKFIKKHYKETELIEDLFYYSDIAITLFNSKNPDTFSEFPLSWAVTVENVKSNFSLTRIFFEFFFERIQNKLYSQSNIAKIVDEQTMIIGKSLFPEVDVHTIFVFFIVLLSFTRDSPEWWAIKTNCSFIKPEIVEGYPPISSLKHKRKKNKLSYEEFEERKNRTFNLISALIKKEWVPLQPPQIRYIKKYKKELKKLQIATDSLENQSRSEILELATNLINILKNKL